MRIAINGFGRIGRMVLRALMETPHQFLRDNIKVVYINDLSNLETNAHLFKYDSVHGPYNGFFEQFDKTFQTNIGTINVLCEPNPEKLPWDDIDIVMECSGFFTKKEAALKHIKSGAKRVLISAPSEGADVTVVYGINHNTIDRHHEIISNASCTTNCLAPLAWVLHQNLGIEKGYMTTIHSYTADQSLVDTNHKDLRRARAASLSMIPTLTGAAKSIGLIIPELKGKLDGTAIRVPTPNVSMVDLAFLSSKKSTVEEINTLMKEASKTTLNGILTTCSLPLVSHDFNHNPYSCIFDTTQTQVVGSDFCRVVGWYDNEWGFANRMLDLAFYLSSDT